VPGGHRQPAGRAEIQPQLDHLALLAGDGGDGEQLAGRGVAVDEADVAPPDDGPGSAPVSIAGSPHPARPTSTTTIRLRDTDDRTGAVWSADRRWNRRADALLDDVFGR